MRQLTSLNDIRVGITYTFMPLQEKYVVEEICDRYAHSVSTRIYVSDKGNGMKGRPFYYIFEDNSLYNWGTETYSQEEIDKLMKVM